MLALLAFLLLAASPQDRIQELQAHLIAPCCWAENVANHQSPAAVQMRAEITRFVTEGKSDREILDFYKAKYGARVLVEPEGRTWWVAFVMPLGAAVVGLWFVVLRIRKMRAPVAAELS